MPPIGRLLCLLGLHKAHTVRPFHQKCDRCGSEWWVDYFQWRQEGWPNWRRLRPGQRLQYYFGHETTPNKD
jgi:hypothetical protein